MHCYINHFYQFLFTILVLHCDYVIITYYYIIHYYVLIHFLVLLHCNSDFTSFLRIITYSLLPIISKSLLHIMTSLLHQYYVLITSLLFHYHQWLKQVMMSSLLHSILSVFIITLLLPILIIITH